MLIFSVLYAFCQRKKNQNSNGFHLQYFPTVNGFNRLIVVAVNRVGVQINCKGSHLDKGGLSVHLSIGAYSSKAARLLVILNS